VPAWLTRLRLKVQRLVTPARDAELDEELCLHLELLEEEHRSAGMTAREARLAARRQFGNRTAIHEASRTLFSFEWLDACVRDARYGIRQLGRSPGFALAVILTVGLSVGAVSAVFTLADPMLFRPLPYPDAERIVLVRALPANPTSYVKVADYLEAEAAHPGFASVASFTNSVSGRLEGSNVPVFAYGITGGFFDVFDVRLAVGRPFLDNEYGVGQPQVAILSHGFWQTALGGRDDVIGQRLRVAWAGGGWVLDIVGVLPPGFVFPDIVNRPPDLLTPLVVDPALRGDVRRGDTELIARLMPGATVNNAAAQMQNILRRVEAAYPAYGSGRQALLIPLQNALFRNTRAPLLMLLGATLCALLLACVNLAHLFLARFRSRERELGIRLALGVGPSRLVRQLATEAGVVALLGGLLSMPVAGAALVGIMVAAPDVPVMRGYRLLPAEIDLRVLGFTLALLVVAVVIFGVVPAMLATRGELRPRLQTGGFSTGRLGRKSSSLVVAQAALAAALLVVCGSIVASFAYLASRPLGFDPTGLQLVTVESQSEARTQYDVVADFALHRQVYEHLRDRWWGAVTLSGGVPGLTIAALADRPDRGAEPPRVRSYPVAGTFFGALELSLVEGRLFDDREAFANAPVAVVDQRAARILWPGGEAVGQAILDTSGTLRTVVGVVATVATSLVSPEESPGTSYTPFPAETRASLLARPTSRPGDLEELQRLTMEAAPTAYVQLNPLLPFEQVLGVPRFLARLLGTLGVLVVALTIVGVFGVVHHEVGRRIRELTIRLFLGASPQRLRGQVLAGALIPATLGVAIGLTSSWPYTATLEALLFGVEPHSPVTLLVAGLLVLLLVVFGSWLPAWRASRLDAAHVLRAE